jgi:hypothetical protein
MDHCRNRGARSGDAGPGHVSDLYNPADSGTALCVLVAEAPQSAAPRHAAADQELDCTVSAAAAALE